MYTLSLNWPTRHKNERVEPMEFRQVVYIEYASRVPSLSIRPF